MSIVYACDGCGASTQNESELEHLGRILPRDYCARCAPCALAYLAAIDAAHTEAARVYEALLDAARAEASMLKALPL